MPRSRSVSRTPNPRMIRSDVAPISSHSVVSLPALSRNKAAQSSKTRAPGLCTLVHVMRSPRSARHSFSMQDISHPSQSGARGSRGGGSSRGGTSPPLIAGFFLRYAQGAVTRYAGGDRWSLSGQTTRQTRHRQVCERRTGRCPVPQGTRHRRVCERRTGRLPAPPGSGLSDRQFRGGRRVPTVTVH